MSPAPRPAVRVSVCMATYRGERWVAEQVTSVLAEIGPDDELVVVDDASPDGTTDVLRQIDDPRLRIVEQAVNGGYVRAFATALEHARGAYLLLSDQDDVWVPGRVEVMLAALQDHDVVAGNLATLGGPDSIHSPLGRPGWRLRASDSGHHLRNVLGVLAGARPYFGCAMGLRREALEVATPFPAGLRESHDLWFALYGNLAGSIAHVDDVVVLRRYHQDNASPDRPRGVVAALRSRLLLVRCVVELRRRLHRSGARRGRPAR